GLRARTRARDPPLPQAQGVARYGKDRHGRRLSRQQGRRAHHRSCSRDSQVAIDLVPIRNNPDQAGLSGAAHLAPPWMFEAHDAIIGVDIGGTNIRAGIVELNLKKASDLSKASVWKFELWRHADEKNVTREEA